MERVSARFFAHLIKDGKAVSAILRCNTTLAQVVDQAGECTPNWNFGETGAETPIVWALSKLSGKEKRPQTFQWKWNGDVITFDQVTGKSNGYYVQTVNGTTYPLFEMTNVEEGGIRMPALKILRNIASLANTENDTISMEGGMECGGKLLNFSIGLPVRIHESAGSGWYGWINGEPRISENSPKSNNLPSTTLTAKLKNGSSVQQAFTAKFFRDGIDTQNPLFTVTTQNGQAQAIFTTSHVTDNIAVRCEFYVEDNLVETAFYNIDDETDEQELQIASQTFTTTDGVTTQTGTGQGDVILREDQETLWTYWMGHRTDPQKVHTGYTEFYVKLTDNEDKVIEPDAYASLLTDGQASGTLADDANFRNVTVSTVTIATGVVAAKAGKLRMTADFLDSHGEGVGGIVVAQ